MSAPLTAAQHANLAAVADRIAPRTAKMPSAGDLGLTDPDGYVDRVLALRPDLAAALPAVLDRAEASASADSMARLSGPDLAVLMQVVAGAYYLHPRVRALIGYAGQEALSLGRGEIGGEGFLAAMMERPPRWRRPPAAREVGA